MKKKICVLLVILIFLSNLLYVSNCYAAGKESIVTKLKMSNITKADTSANSNGLLKSINGVIGLLQLVGSGIAIIVVTILGIKYILASPSDKADVKKAIMPILIGCILLFGGVNIVAIIADISEKTASAI